MWTLVQHSAFIYEGNTDYEKGLEAVKVPEGSESRVRAAQGILFESYGDCIDKAHAWSYPRKDDVFPNAMGTFSEARINGLPLYQPVRIPVG